MAMDQASMLFHWDVRAGAMGKGECRLGNGTGIQSGIRGSYRIYGSSLTAISCSSEINLENFQLRCVGWGMSRSFLPNSRITVIVCVAGFRPGSRATFVPAKVAKTIDAPSGLMK